MWPCLVWGRGFLGLVALLRAFSLAAPGFEGAFFTSSGVLHTFLTSPGLEGPSLTLLWLFLGSSLQMSPWFGFSFYWGELI